MDLMLGIVQGYLSSILAHSSLGCTKGCCEGISSVCISCETAKQGSQFSGPAIIPMIEDNIRHRACRVDSGMLHLYLINL